MAYDTEEAVPVQALNRTEKLQRFKDWLLLSSEAEATQRANEREDLAFNNTTDGQWTPEALLERAGRPILTISLLHQPLQLVYNQASSADLGVDVTPVDERTDDDLAEKMQGLYRRIQRDGGAKAARMWAFNRAIQCGRGWYRINTKYDEDSENPSDQEITFERILFQEQVYPDPASQKADFSDARFFIIRAYVPCDEYRRRFPRAGGYDASDFDGLLSSEPDWIRRGSKGNDPLVVECYYKEITLEKVTLDTADGPWERDVERVTVWRAVISGLGIIEDEPWLGGGIMYLPIIPVIGRELQPVNGERRWEGMVRPAMGAQRTYNYANSTLVEDISKLSKIPTIGAEGSFEGHEPEWDTVNRVNRPYIEYKPKTFEGHLLPPPAPMQIDGTKMQLSLQLSQESKGFVQITTAVYEPSLGEMQAGAKGQSGKAIQALQQQADAGTGNYVGNLGEITLPAEARLILNMIPIVYDRPGRVTQVLGGEDETKTVMFNQPYVMDQKTGQPAALPEAPPLQPGQPEPGLPQGAKHYDLSKGKYSIAVTVGKSFQTRQQEGAEEMGQLLGAVPPELQVLLLPTWMRFKDTPGAKETADILTKYRDMKFPGLANKEGDQPTPEQMQAQVQAQAQQIEEMKAQLMEAAEAIKTDQAKQQATIQKAAMDQESSAHKASQDAQLKQMLAQFEAAHEVAMENDKQQHAMDLEAMKLDFERWKVQFEAAHEAALAAAGGMTSKTVRDRGQTDEREDTQESGQDASQESSQSFEDPGEEPTE